MPLPATPLRVQVLIDSLNWGGAEMLLADYAAAAPAAGIELSVAYLNDLNGSPAAAGLKARGVEPQLVHGGRLLELPALSRLRRHLAQMRPDIVHTQLELSDVLGTLAARSLGLPCVSTIHLLARQPTGQLADSGVRALAKARLAASVRRHVSARVLAVSSAARDAYLQTGWDVPSHVVVAHNGIAREPRTGDRERVRGELGIGHEELVVTILTVLRPGKGHDVVVEAVRRLLSRFPNLRLLVLGDGPARDRIHHLARPLGEAALLIGHYQDAMAVLSATDVLVHPTVMDAFPTALLEAAAAGVPVIATAVGGIPEIVEDGRTGFLIPSPASAAALADSLTPLLADERLRRGIGQRAHARFCEHFTARLWVQRLRRIYEEVLAGGCAHSPQRGAAGESNAARAAGCEDACT
jgi:glycosyltransferase involved in cell wall biosynthesis